MQVNKPKILSKLDELLKPFSVQDGGPYNLMCGASKYNLVNETAIKQFCQLLSDCYTTEPGRSLFKLSSDKKAVIPYQFHIPSGADGDETITRLRFDCDLHFYYAEDELAQGNSFSQLTALHNETKLNKCVEIFYQVIRETIPTIRNEHLCCAILTKPFRNDTQKKMFKHGFHLEFPFIFIKNFHVKKIVAMVNFRIKDQNLFPNFFVADNQFPSSPWLLYGQPKHGAKPDLPIYTVDKFLNHKFEVKTVEEFFEPLDKSNLIDLFWLFPRRGDNLVDFSYEYLTNDVDIESDEEVEEGEEAEGEETKAEQEKQDPVQLVEDMLSGLSQKRCEQTKSWRSIVCSVTNFLRENKVREREIFTIVDAWSQQSTLGNYDRHAVQHLVDTAKDFKDHYNIWVLKKYWRIDNFKERLLLEASDDSMARIIHDEYKGSIFFTGVNKLESYTFNQEKLLWLKCDCARALYNEVSCCLENLLGIVSKSVYKRNPEATPLRGKTRSATGGALLKCLNNAKNRIKSDRSVNGIISRLTKYCTDTDFENKLNSNPTLFPIRGGRVIDLATGLVRDRKQSDFFTFESPVGVTEDIAFGQKFFLDLAKNNGELAVHMACLCYYFLTGHTFDRGIYQFIGEGMNGKSTLISILEILLGPLSMVGEKRAVIKDVKHGNRNDGPQPFILAMKNKRLVVVSETDEGDRLNSGNIKMLTGGDTISGRKLFSNLIESFTMTAKIVVCTNYKLEFHVEDQAVKDRVKFIPFENRFEKNQRYMDDIKKNVDGKLDSIFSYMVNVGRKIVQEQKLTTSVEVEKKTLEVFKELDIVQQFIEEKCLVGSEEYCATSELYDAFKNYCIENRKDADSKPKFFSIIHNKKFEKEKNKRFSNGSRKDVFKGIRLV